MRATGDLCHGALGGQETTDEEHQMSTSTDKATADTPQSEMQAILEKQRRAFQLEPHVEYGTRIDRLDRAIALLVDNQEAICEALSADYGCRSPYMTRMSEIMTSVGNLKHVKKKLKRWMKPEKRSAPGR